MREVSALNLAELVMGNMTVMPYCVVLLLDL
jgi:hypothetical protein